jgi:repressor LexA
MMKFKRGEYMNDIEQKNIFSKNLNRYLSINNKTQREVADAINVSPQTFNTWCQGIALPRMGKVQRLADYFGIGKSDLIDDKHSVPETLAKSRSVTINVLGRVAAGIPIEAVENIIDTEEISEDMAKTGEYFGLQIHGDSMEPRMYEGDVVIVRQQDDAESGDIVIALINGNDATCKRLTKYAGYITLSSLNQKYEPIMFSNEDIINKPVKIIGKVVELRGKL